MKEFNGYWYIYIHSKLKERSSNNLVRLSEAKEYIGEWKIPKPLRIVIIKELEQLDLIKIEKEFISIRPSKINIENISGIYSNIGILN